MSTLGFLPNRITHWTVRVPGNTSWSDGHKTEKAAKRERDKANRVCRPGHQVYAKHENGDVTGPY